ncbi:MAG: FecR domain-containing protein [Hyphomicrobiaceae bacterium]
MFTSVVLAAGAIVLNMAGPASAQQVGFHDQSKGGGLEALPDVSRSNGEAGAPAETPHADPFGKLFGNMMHTLFGPLLGNGTSNGGADREVNVSGRRIGKVVHSAGVARIERGGPALQISAGSEVESRDRLETAGGARVILKLADGTRVALGERSSLTFVRFMADHERATGALVLHMGRGMMRLTTTPGREQGDKRFEVRTAAATVEGGVSDVLLRLDGEALDVLLLSGRANVRNLAGIAEVDRAQHIIERVVANAPPGNAHGWRRQQVRQYVAAVEGP